MVRAIPPILPHDQILVVMIVVDDVRIDLIARRRRDGEIAALQCSRNRNLLPINVPSSTSLIMPHYEVLVVEGVVGNSGLYLVF